MRYNRRSDMANSITLSDSEVRSLAERFGTPLYVYSEEALKARAKELSTVPSAFGVKTRYAMKACPNAGVIRAIRSEGVAIDASSGFEVERAMLIGVPASEICLTAQELPRNISSLLEAGIEFNVSSLLQLETIGKICKAEPSIAKLLARGIGVRLNPGLGSGHSMLVNTGGPTASFGIWKEYAQKAFELAKSYNLRISRVHSHIGAGNDPAIWEKASHLTLGLVKHFPDADTVSLGGGFKTARMPYEKETDLHSVAKATAEIFRAYAKETGRELKLELEPGTFLVACAGAILSRIMDISDTGNEGYNFLKLDAGMTEIIRPAMYGSQHPFSIHPAVENRKPGAVRPFLVVGHCCESGDILTPNPENSQGLKTRDLPTPEIGDYLVIGGAGAYCASMSAVNYNSFPQAAEVLLKTDRTFELTRSRQTLKQVLQNEVI